MDILKLDTKEIKRGGLSFIVRNNTLDEYVVDEVLKPYEYLTPMKMRHGEKILDIGMNIGAFAVLASYVGCRVVGYEPDSENYAVAQENIKRNDSRVTAINRGVLDTKRQEKLYLCGKKSRCKHTIIPTKGRDVIIMECDGINDVLREVKPDKVKIDCEGGEYAILLAVRNWRNVRLVHWEWHRKLLEDQSNEKLEEVLCKLEADGFKVKQKKNARKCLRTKKGWTQMITAERT